MKPFLKFFSLLSASVLLFGLCACSKTDYPPEAYLHPEGDALVEYLSGAKSMEDLTAIGLEQTSEEELTETFGSQARKAIGDNRLYLRSRYDTEDGTGWVVYVLPTNMLSDLVVFFSIEDKRPAPANETWGYHCLVAEVLSFQFRVSANEVQFLTQSCFAYVMISKTVLRFVLKGDPTTETEVSEFTQTFFAPYFENALLASLDGVPKDLRLKTIDLKDGEETFGTVKLLRAR